MKRFLSILSNIVLYLPNIALGAYTSLMFIFNVIEYISVPSYGRYAPRTSISYFNLIVGVILITCTVVGWKSGKISKRVLLAWATFALYAGAILLSTLIGFATDGFGSIDKNMPNFLIMGGCLFAITLICVLVAKLLRRIAAR